MATGIAETLLVEISARTVELEARLAGAEAKLARFEKTAKQAGDGASKGLLSIKSGIEPTTIALTAVGAALLAVGTKATLMAAKTDGALRQISAASPGVGRNLSALKDEIDGVAQATGRQREEIFTATEQISRLGVASNEELKAKRDAALLIADATGAQLGTMVDGIDQLADAFELSTDQVVNSVAKMASAARGKVDFDAIFGVFASSSSAIKAAGLDYETAVRVVVRALDEGMNVRAVKALFTDHDTEQLKEYAKGATIAADALEQLKDAADFRRGGADREFQRDLNAANAALEELGARILPVAISAMRELVFLIDYYTGKSGSAQVVQSINGIVAASSRVKLGDNDLSELQDGLRSLFPGEGDDNGVTLAAGQAAKLTTEQIRAANAALRILISTSDMGDRQLANARRTVAQLQAELQKRDLLTPGASGKTTDAGTGTKSPPSLGPTKDEMARIRAAKDAFESAIASASPGKLDDTEKRILSLVEKAKAAGLSVGQIATYVARLRSAIAETAKAQAQALKDDIGSALAKFSGSQADALEAANKKLVDEMRTRLAAATGASNLDKAAEEARIERVKALGDQAVAAARAFEQMDAEDRKAAAGLAELDAHATALNEAESQLTATQQLQGRSREQQKETEEDLLNVQGKQLALARARIEVDNAEIGRAQRQLSVLQELARTEEEGSAARLQTEERIRALEEKIRKLLLEIQQLRGAPVKAEAAAQAARARHIQQLQQQSYLIRESVSAALQLAGAFGAVSDETAAAMQNIADIAANIPLAMKGDPQAIFAIAGSAAGLISSLVRGGDDEATRKNTEALKELTAKAGLIGESLLGGRSGATAVDVARKLKASGIDDAKGSRLSPVSIAGLTDAELAAFKRAAEEFGVTLDYSGQSYRDAVNLILEAAGKLGEFGDDYQSRLAQFDAYRKIFNDETPQARLLGIKAAADSASPALSHLFDGITNLTDPQSLALLTERVQALFHVMELGGGKLTKEQMGELGGDELVQALEQIITEIGNLTPKVLTAAEQLAKARGDLSTEFEIMGSDVGAQLKRVADLYGGKGGALGRLVEGLDPSKADSIAALEQRIRDLFTQLQAAPDSVDLAGMSIEELIVALLDLKHGADAAAAGVKSAADLLAEAANSLKTDFEVFGTDQASQAEGVANLYKDVGGIGAALQGINLKTASGRAAAIAALQQLYGADKSNSAQTAAILEILRTLRAVPAEAPADEGGERPASDGGDGSRVTNAVRSITDVTGNRMADYLASILVGVRELPERLSALLTQLGTARIVAPATVGAAGSGGTTNIYRITVHQLFQGAVTPATAALVESAGDAAGRQITDDLDRAMGGGLRVSRLMSGNPYGRG